MSTGRFAWYELMTNNVAGARAFYTEVMGWTAEDAKMPGMEYWLFNAGKHQVGGLMAVPPEAAQMGQRPAWFGYVSVDDVDASAARVTALGGAVHVPPQDIPNVGRFAMVADPDGAAFYLFASARPGEDLPFLDGTPGLVGWHELYAKDHTALWPFYEALFGWEKVQTMDMGPMGVYQTFGFDGKAVGGMMNHPPGAPVSWQFYVFVGNIDDGIARVKNAGGAVHVGPMEVPGGGWIARGSDPQGASFALLGNR